MDDRGDEERPAQPQPVVTSDDAHRPAREFLAEVQARKEALGLVDDEVKTESLRNRGATRTPAKRLLLSRIQQRATAAGLRPVKSYFQPLGEEF